MTLRFLGWIMSWFPDETIRRAQAVAKSEDLARRWYAETRRNVTRT